MNSVWFTADTHFGHKNILGFEPTQRPFNNIEEMNETIIERWNAVVKNQDTVYHLGDFCFGKHNLSLGGRLNGRKRLVMGNHDHYDSAEYLLYFEKLYGAKDWERCILTHIPVHPNNLGARFFLNVHGHLHSKKVQKDFEVPYMNTIMIDEQRNDLNYFCVSLEQNNLTPIHADVIRDRVKSL